MDNNLKIRYVDINKLKPFEKNPRIHPKSAKDKVKKSIKEFGWTNPILVNKKGTIIAGHLRYEVAQELEMDKVPVVVLPFDVNQSTLYNIADNRLQEETDWDYENLENIFRELNDIDLTITGFNKSQIEKLLNIPVNYGNETIEESYQIVIECDNEDQQRDYYEKFVSEGMKCRLLIL